MNFKKVEAYTRAGLEKYRAQYPAEILEGLKVSCCSGSFGACLLTIRKENEEAAARSYNVIDKFVGNYSAIDSVISDFIIRNYHLITERVYREHAKENKKAMSCTLYIYNDDKLVNTFYFKEAEAVKSELIKILISDKRRGTKTTYKPKPYTNDIKIIQKWDKEAYCLTHNTKYIYEFKNIDY